MQKTIHLFIFLILVAIGCNESEQAPVAKTSAKQEATELDGNIYTIITTVSNIGWQSTYKGGLDPHYGTIAIKNGSISIENDSITGGFVDINMKSIENLDIPDAAQKQKLEQVLKSKDFFEVEKYPSARFEMTSIGKYDSTKGMSKIPNANFTLSGNLTLKDTTFNISFPVYINKEENNFSLNAVFDIDRTSWGLTYQNGNNPKDWLLQKKIEITLNIKAKR